MNWYWILIIFCAVSLAIFLVIFLVYKKAKQAKASPYEEALIALIDGDEDKALKCFQEAVFENSDNVEAYIRLAELLRKRKEPLKALQIHKYLLARRSLSKKTRNRILSQMASDYIALEAYQKAIETLKQLLRTEPHNEKVYRLLLLCYEKSGLWHESMELFRKTAKIFSYDQNKMALYEVYAAYEAHKAGNTDFALKLLHRVLKTNPKNIPALLYLADINTANGKIDDAVAGYQKIVEIAPSSAHLMFPQLKKAYFEKGEYQKVESTYRSILERIPDDTRAIAALSELYLKMGRFSEAHELLRAALDNTPDSLILNLLLLLTEMEEEKSDSAATLRHLIETIKKKEVFRCKECAALAQAYRIRCPVCGGWETYVPEEMS
jgi:lipopolysaccharide biosynthesis regulator YciM